MHGQQITYLSSNQRRTHTVRFLCCFVVTIASNIEAWAYLSSAIFCRHCRDVRSNVCHGSTISSADFLRKLNHDYKSWLTLSIVWLLLNDWRTDMVTLTRGRQTARPSECYKINCHCCCWFICRTIPVANIHMNICITVQRLYACLYVTRETLWATNATANEYSASITDIPRHSTAQSKPTRRVFAVRVVAPWNSLAEYFCVNYKCSDVWIQTG